MAELHRKRLVVKGRVQGVGFRFYIIRLSENFNVAGYVRNILDDGVEIVAEGSPEQVESFITLAARGPSGSRVVEVKTYQEQPQGSYKSFGVQY